MSKVGKDAWHTKAHSSSIDYLAYYPAYLLKKHYNGFNEVRMLRQNILKLAGSKLFEIGCATGDFYRYLRLANDQIEYHGFDISEQAIQRAQRKYGQKLFSTIANIEEIGKTYGKADVVFCRDVVLHQENPFEFVDNLLTLADKYLLIRLRTRDKGDTVLDTQLSCQRLYGQFWIPYMVLNIDELIDRIKRDLRVDTIVISRSHEVLGGFNGRFLPKDLYLEETGTAETAIFIKLGKETQTGQLKVIYDDKKDRPRFTLLDRQILRVSLRLKGANIAPAHPGVRI